MSAGENQPVDQAPASDVESHRMPLMEHLLELRTRMMWSIGALFLGVGISFAVVEDIYFWLTSPFMDAILESGMDGGLALVNSPFEGFYTYLRVALVGGVAISAPMIAYQVWQFIAPGLYKSERRVVIPLAVTSTTLFFSGAMFCYYAIFPYAFPFFLQVIDIEASLSVSGYLTAVIKMMGAFGLCFQLPVITWFAARMGLIDHRDLIDSFRYAIVGIFVIAAVITPPDPLTQSLLAGPLIILYTISIGVAWLVSTKVRD